VAAYAVMSNHYHLVLRVDAERARGWSREEVLRRWTQLFDGPKLVQTRFPIRLDTQDAASLQRVDEWAETYRSRLMDISWFMRVLNNSQKDTHFLITKSQKDTHFLSSQKDTHFL